MHETLGFKPEEVMCIWNPSTGHSNQKTKQDQASSIHRGTASLSYEALSQVINNQAKAKPKPRR